MVMPNLGRVWTREEVLALPDDGNRYELIDGDLLVSPSPTWTHQRAVGQLFLLIAPFVDAHGIGTTLFSPADLDLKAEQLAQPDLFVVERSSHEAPTRWSDLRVPMLVVEILSPSTVRYDRITKRGRYQRSRISEYWIVDTDARRIERWRPDDREAEIITRSITWQPSAGGPALTIDLDRLFAKVWEEASLLP